MLLGNLTTYTLAGLQSSRTVYLALCAMDSIIGPYANASWYANNVKGIQPLSVQTAIDPTEPAVADNGKTTLFFVSGSPSFSGQGWDNAVDADLDGWDGTVSTRGDAFGFGSNQQIHQGPAWAIFKFSDDSLRQINSVSIQTDNGIAEQYVHNRWATKLEVLVSQTDASAAAFTSVRMIERTTGGMISYALTSPVNARFVKLMIYQPNKTSGAWRQLAEFKVAFIAGLTKNLEDESVKPLVYTLYQNYPNPFNPTTTIRYELAKDGAATLNIYDLNGRELATLVNKVQSAGMHEVVWNPANYPSGIYFYRLKAGAFTKLQRMVFIK